MLESGAEVARLPGREIVAHDTETTDAMMEAIESCGVELIEPLRNHPAPRPQAAIESIRETHVEAVGEEMAAAKSRCVGDEFVDAQSDRSVVRGDDRTGAHADDRIDRDVVTNQLPKQAGMRRAAQPAGAQHEAETNLTGCIVHCPEGI